MNKNSLSFDGIRNNLKTEYIGKDLLFFEETTSTFDEADSQTLKNGMVICAKRQTKGRGRLGRSWESSDGGIYFSVILKPDLTQDEVHIMTAMCAVGIQRAISSILPCYIKWPNDIVSENGKKLCGILTKLQHGGDDDSYINVGIGINANTKSFGDELKYASSIALVTGNCVDENLLLCNCLKEIENVCSKSDALEIMKEYKLNCITLGKRVRVLYAHEEKSETGLCVDIKNDGSLVVNTDDGRVINVGSGEVSVRGIYGEKYV